MQRKLGVFCVVGFLFSAGCATIHRLDSAKLPVVPVSQVIENPSQWEDIGKEINEGKTVVFKIAQGQKIPLRLIMDSPIGKVEKTENILAFNRDVYLSIAKTGFQISPDGQRWTNLGDWRAVKKLFGYKKGQLMVGFHAKKDEGTFISLDISAK